MPSVRQGIISFFCYVAIQGAICTGSPVSSSGNVLAALADMIETNTNDLVQRLPRDGEQTTSSGPQLYFPGIGQIILGVVTGDIRRIVEDGAFSFIPSGPRQQALLIFRNLFGRNNGTATSTATTTTKPKSTTATTAEPEEGEASGLTDEPDEPDESESSSRRTRTRRPLFSRRSTSAAAVPQTTLAATAAPEPEEEEEEEELVARFENTLLPYLPANPQDAVPTDYPKIL